MNIPRSRVHRELEPLRNNSDDPGADYNVSEPTFSVDYSGGSMVRDRPKNLLVPLGCAVTAGVLGVGLFSFATGNSAMSQKMMRARLLAQGLTVAAMTFSMPWVWGGEDKGKAAGMTVAAGEGGDR